MKMLQRVKGKRNLWIKTTKLLKMKLCKYSLVWDNPYSV